MKRECWLAAAAIVVILAVAGFTSETVRARLRAQLDIGAGSGDGPVQLSAGEPPLNHGIIPAKYPVHVPRYAHMGPHRMYRHPRRASPNLTAPHQVDYDWLYCPPAQGDL